MRIVGQSDHERVSSALLFAYTLLTTGSYMLHRSIGDGMLLGKFGHAALPTAMLLSAIVIAPLTWAIARFFNQSTVHRVIIGTRLLLAFSTILLYAYRERFEYDEVFLLLIYLLAKLRGCINTIHFATLFYESLGEDASHRVSMTMAGAPLAGIVAGMALGLGADDLSFGYWFVIVAVIDLLAIAPVLLLHRLWHQGKLAMLSGLQPERLAAPLAEQDEMSANNLQRLIGCLIIVKTFSMTLITFEWKAAAADYFVGQPATLAAFFGGFYGVSDAIALGLQMFVIGQWLRRWGPSPSLVALPLAAAFPLLLTLTSRTTLWHLIYFTMAKSSDVLRRSWHDPSLTLLYRRFSPSDRARRITWNNGVLKPLAEACMVIAIYSAMEFLSHPRSLTLLTLAVVIIWIAVGRLTRGMYDSKQSGEN